MTAESPASGDGNIGFSLRDLPCNVSVLRVPGGLEHVCLSQSGRSIQLVCSGASLLSDDVTFYIAYADLRDSKQKLLTLERLIALDRTGEFPSRLFKPHPRARTIRFALQALDGDLAGVRHRKIAETILGAEAVAAGWSGETRYAKSQFYRYLYYGRALVDREYRTLLR